MAGYERHFGSLVSYGSLLASKCSSSTIGEHRGDDVLKSTIPNTIRRTNSTNPLAHAAHRALHVVRLK